MGDRVNVRIVKEKARWARGEVVEWLEKGPARRKAPCIRYDQCDGCSLQHLVYPEQLAWKGRLVGDALRRVGGLEAEDPEVMGSPEEFRYRNRLTFTLRRLPGNRVVAGFRELGHTGRVLDIGSECLLPQDPIPQVWEALRANWGAGAALLPEGRELRLTLRGGEDGVGLLVRGGFGDGDPGSLLDRIPELTSIWREDKGGARRHLAGAPTLSFEWAGERLELSGAGFVQVNQRGGEALQRYVLERVGDVGGKRVIDAYCGLGALGRALAAAGAIVVGIEVDPAGAEVAAAHPTPGFTLVTGRVEDALPGLLPVELVILNPPRTGLEESIPRTLSTGHLETIIYVSCDPATLARDLQRLAGSFLLERVRSFDLFPQTGHVETVVTLRGRRQREP